MAVFHKITAYTCTSHTHPYFYLFYGDYTIPDWVMSTKTYALVGLPYWHRTTMPLKFQNTEPVSRLHSVISFEKNPQRTCRVVLNNNIVSLYQKTRIMHFLCTKNHPGENQYSFKCILYWNNVEFTYTYIPKLNKTDTQIHSMTFCITTISPKTTAIALRMNIVNSKPIVI